MTSEKQKIGKDFEKEAFNFLKLKFDKVFWMSKKNPINHFDFKCFKKGIVYYIEAKRNSFSNVPTLRSFQKEADYVIFKGKNEKIVLIPKKDYDNKVRIDEGINIRIKKSTMQRLRIAKAERELSVYDDLINIALDELERK